MSIFNKFNCCSGEDANIDKKYEFVMSNDEAKRTNRFKSNERVSTRRVKSKVGKGPRYESP
jgi:hypothetical protein